MKLKINKACDLSSISVLPPHARRSSNVSNGAHSAVIGRSQASQLRSQPSQQSFSQGLSSQPGMFSQLSQNSLDEIVTNDQRISSQERENSVKKISCLPPMSYALEESQMPISRSSTNLMRKWNSSSLPDQRTGQIGEELERRIGMIETSLNRFGMILDSVQSDIMQVNKGTKEVLMEMESIRQKLVANEILLQLMNRGQEDIKTNLAGSIKSLSDQVSQDIYQERLKDISSAISALPEHIDVCLQQLKFEVCKTVTKEIEAVAYSLKIPSQNHLTPTVLVAKGISRHSIPQQLPSLKKPEVLPKVCVKATVLPKIEVGSWTSVKAGKATFSYRGTHKEHNQKRLSPIQPERECRIHIDSDEEIDRGFSCLLEGKETGNYSAEAKEETKRILRKARRRKRKHCNTIILD